MIRSFIRTMNLAIAGAIPYAIGWDAFRHIGWYSTAPLGGFAALAIAWSARPLLRYWARRRRPSRPPDCRYP